MTPHSPLPAKHLIEQFDLFDGLELGAITVVSSAAAAAHAMAQLTMHAVVGFDTESRPTFHRHEASDGPHVIQFATLHHAFIFQSHVTESLEVLKALLASPSITKAGFGLANDLRHLKRKFGVTPAAMLDLNHVFNAHGHRNSIGARGAIALLFNQRLPKSKRITTSNWANPQLSDKQILYAANDAYAALRVYHALTPHGLPSAH